MTTIHIDALVTKKDEDFVDSCYRQLLKREADPQGKAHYLSRLRQGRTKVSVLHDIARSKEARIAGTHVVGLPAAYAIERITATPVVGAIFAFARTILGSRRLWRELETARNAAYAANAKVTELTSGPLALSRLDEIHNTLNSLHEFMRVTQRQLDALSSATSSSPSAGPDTHGPDRDELRQSYIRFSRDAQRSLLQLEQQMSKATDEWEHERNRTREELDAVHASLKRATDRHASDIAGIASSVHSEHQALEAITAHFSTTQSRIDDVTNQIDRLWKRLEFVRSETLYELKYGATPRYAQKVKINPKILNENAVQQARGRGGLRLNIGCGHLPHEGYINVDARELPGIDIIADATLLPLADNEAIEIRAEHLLEHFPEQELRRAVLPEWRRVLKAGGQLNVVVPDVEVMLDEYHKGTYPHEYLREVLYGGQEYGGDFHHNMFMPTYLEMLLREGGFANIEWKIRGRKNGKCFEMELAAC